MTDGVLFLRTELGKAFFERRIEKVRIISEAVFAVRFMKNKSVDRSEYDDRIGIVPCERYAAAKPSGATLIRHVF